MSADNTETLSNYDKKKESIKRYLNNRYETDLEWRQKMITEKKKKQSIRYATDLNYRERILRNSQIKRDAKRLERMSVATC